jgi:hypothetical protein
MNPDFFCFSKPSDPTGVDLTFFFCFRVYSRINQHHPIPKDLGKVGTTMAVSIQPDRDLIIRM